MKLMLFKPMLVMYIFTKLQYVSQMVSGLAIGLLSREKWEVQTESKWENFSTHQAHHDLQTR